MSMVAVKILSDNATKEAAAAFEKEMKMLMECNFQHKNVVNLLGEQSHLLCLFLKVACVMDRTYYV